jgi:formate hydrogenlyase transcriptional activator
MGRHIDTIPTSVLESLRNYNWPGNIRELQNVLERSVILTHGSGLQVAMPELIRNATMAPLTGTSSARSDNTERDRILKALEEARGQIGGPDGAAARLGLKRTTLQSRMRKYNISRQYR